MTDDRSTETEPHRGTGTRRTFLTALAGVAGVGGVSMARETLTGGDERLARAFRLRARPEGWRGGSPAAISGETNPTLELRAGETYELAWKNASGTPQNFAFRDSNGDDLPVIGVAAPDGRGQNATTTDGFCPGGRNRRNQRNDTTGTVGTVADGTAGGNFGDTTTADGVGNGTGGRLDNGTTGTVGPLGNESDGGFFNTTTADGGGNATGGRRLGNDTTAGGFFNDTTAGGFSTGTTDGGFFNGTTDGIGNATTDCPGGGRLRDGNRSGDNFTDTTVGTAGTVGTTANRSARTGVVRTNGATRRFRFVAVEEMTTYVSTTDPETMVGDIAVEPAR